MSAAAVRFRVDFGRRLAIGPGKIALLERIGVSGSLSQAARDLDMSYRRAWQLLASLNGSFREPVTRNTKGGYRGGGSTLTGFGRQLIRIYRAFEARTQQRAVRAFRPIEAKVRGARTRRKVAAAAPVLRLKDR
jgi:molybdate transport system regulatory protein